MRQLIYTRKGDLQEKVVAWWPLRRIRARGPGEHLKHDVAYRQLIPAAVECPGCGAVRGRQSKCEGCGYVAVRKRSTKA